MNNDKPTPKGRIGPAMQWAKPRTHKDASAGRGNREIKIELPDVSDQSDPTAYDLGERAISNETSGRGASPSSSDELTSHGRRSPAEPTESDSTGPWWQRGTEHSDGEGSAWSEYTTTLTRSAGERFTRLERDVEQTLTTYNYGSEDYESSVPDTYQRETAAHNASSFDGAQPAASHDDRTVWWQYLLPLAVVGLVIFLALLTLIT